jgi:acetoin:2,6-dichlorophenolindophenol oxidoreductase subunit alpha
MRKVGMSPAMPISEKLRGNTTGVDESGNTSSSDELLILYEKMLLLRVFEDELYLLFLKGEVPGTMHLYQGQEAVAVGVCTHLRPQDILMAPHRPHGHGLAKGMDPASMMAEILGKAGGCCGGKGGSMHVGDMRVGMPPALGIVGAGIPIAAGAALGFKLYGLDHIAVSFFGDGSTNTGAFHEGLTLASVWNLPVVFVCENNLYGVSTKISAVSKLTDLAEHGRSYGMRSVVVDGNDVLAVSNVAEEAVRNARLGNGPTLIEAKTYRHGGHSRTDPGAYRPKGEKEAWLKKDPLPRYRKWLEDNRHADEGRLLKIEAEVKNEIEKAISFALASPLPELSAALTDSLTEKS